MILRWNMVRYLACCRYLVFSASCCAVGSAHGQHASFSLIDVDIRQAAATVQSFIEQPVMLDQKVAGRVSLVSLSPLDMRGAVKLLAAVARAKGWYPEINQGHLIIRAAPPIAVELWESNSLVRGYPLFYRAAAEISPQLRKLLSPQGSIGAIDDSTLLIQDVQRVHYQVSKALVELDAETGGGRRTSVAPQRLARTETTAEEVRRTEAPAVEKRPPAMAAAGQDEDYGNEHLRATVTLIDRSNAVMDDRHVSRALSRDVPPPIRLHKQFHFTYWLKRQGEQARQLPSESGQGIIDEGSYGVLEWVVHHGLAIRRLMIAPELTPHGVIQLHVMPKIDDAVLSEDRQEGDRSAANVVTVVTGQETVLDIAEQIGNLPPAWVLMLRISAIKESDGGVVRK